MPIVIDHMALNDILGPPLFDMEVSASRPQLPSTLWLVLTAPAVLLRLC